MKRNGWLLPAVILFVAAGSVMASSDSPQAIANLYGNRSAVESLNGFAFDFFHHLGSEDDNAVISPCSVFLSLAMTRAGAGYETLHQMSQVLHISNEDTLINEAVSNLIGQLTASRDSTGRFKLSIVNALWGQKGYSFLSEFTQTVYRYYSPEGLGELDFSASPESSRTAINDWVSENTFGKIQSLLPDGSITSATRLVLATAVYFSADWVFQFDPILTRDELWTLLSGEQVSVPTMSISEHFPAAQGDGYRAVELPYRETSISMIIILPDSGRFHEIQDKFDSDLVREITDDLDDTSLYLRLPRFRTSLSLNLQDLLSSMGMPAAFGPGADFSGMDGTLSLYISAAYHQAYISVDENGTEAAAASAVVMAKLDGEPAVDFFVDRPFLYLIRDRRTGAILFMGRVTDPRE